MIKPAILSAAVLTLIGGLSGCATELPAVPMTPEQTKTYNDCMKNHWSGGTDAVMFGFVGANYHQNVVIACRQLALAPQSPAKTAGSTPAKAEK